MPKPTEYARRGIEHTRELYHETATELKKCTWPTRTELTESTVVVIVSLILLSSFVFTCDWVVQLGLRLVTAGF